MSGMKVMNSKVLALGVVAWLIGPTLLFAQSNALSNLTEQTQSSIEGAEQRGRIDPTGDAEGPVGPSAENVREVFQDLLGTDRQRPRLNMNIENLNDRRNSRRRRGRQNPPPPVHVQFQPQFPLYQLSPTQVASGVQVRLDQLLARRAAGAVSVSLDGRKAVLSGTVQSEYQRKLLHKLVEIEPGVSRVENQIAVEPSAAAAPQ